MRKPNHIRELIPIGADIISIMTKTHKIINFLILLGLTSCVEGSEPQMKANLIAQREAPVGWVRFKTYPDSTFVYTRGRGDGTHMGTYKLKGDTLYLSSTDTSMHCEKVFIGDNSVEFIGKDTPGFASIVTNSLTK